MQRVVLCVYGPLLKSGIQLGSVDLCGHCTKCFPGRSLYISRKRSHLNTFHVIRSRYRADIIGQLTESLYVQKRIAARGYETRLISGITSFCAAAARTNTPLAEWNEQLHILPAVHRLDSRLEQPGNYVLMKSGKKMNQVKEILAASGRDVVMVENCGMENEHIYQSVEEIPDDAGYYSLIIAKEARTAHD